MHIHRECVSVFDGRAARRRAARFGSDVGTLDGQRLQVGRRIFRIEHLAVEEGFLAARLRGRDIGRGNAERLAASRQISSRLTWRSAP
jgi:hypothetical protein